jgi:hypothetical protein
MVSSGLLRRVALVRTDVSEEPDASYLASYLTSVYKHYTSIVLINAFAI